MRNRFRNSAIQQTIRCSELRTKTARTDNIRGFETRLSENKGSLKTTLCENVTTLDDMSRQAATPAATLSAV